MDWLPDLTFAETTAVVRDVLSLGLAALGAYLAYLGIKMGRDAWRIGHHQPEPNFFSTTCRIPVLPFVVLVKAG